MLHCGRRMRGGEFELENAHLWNGLDDPYLYTIQAELYADGEKMDQVSARFGCRQMKFDPENGFFLNGRSYPLRGVSRHQDRAGVGNALTKEMHREDLELIREIGANTIRLAHYQHAQYFYDICDEAGMVVWAEIPYITLHMENGRENTLSQMKELIIQNYNHPCIACWGLSNEISAAGGVTEDLLENHRLLNVLCHKLDYTRPTTMAHVFMLERTVNCLRSRILEVTICISDGIWENCPRTTVSLTSITGNTLTAASDFRNMGRTPIRRSRLQNRNGEITPSPIRLSIMSTFLI